MTRIVLLHEGEQPTLEEMYICFQYLVENYDVSLKKMNSNDMTSKIMKETDVIICVRGHSPISYYVLSEARRLGKKVFFMLDDDLKNMPKGAFWFPRRKKWLLKCLGQCEGLITPNRLIGEDYKEYLCCERIIPIDTVVDSRSMKLPRKNSNVTKIVMAASEWHTFNFESIVKKACIRLAEKYKEGIEFCFIGLRPELREAETYSKVEYVPSMNMEDYVKYMKDNWFDIGIAVLRPDHFSERKYFNKFIEYTRYGICGVYTECMPYQLVVKDGVNGIFTSNTAEDWYVAIEKVIDNPRFRLQCVENAQEYLKINHSEEEIFSKIIGECPELIDFCTKEGYEMNYMRVVFGKVHQLLFRVAESVYLTFSSLSHFGIKTTVYKIKRKLGMSL